VILENIWEKYEVKEKGILEGIKDKRHPDESCKLSGLIQW